MIAFDETIDDPFADDYLTEIDAAEALAGDDQLIDERHKAAITSIKTELAKLKLPLSPKQQQVRFFSYNRNYLTKRTYSVPSLL